jgi:hypothetical protein
VAPDRWGPEPPAAIPAGAWWRTERQTFLPVPGRDEAVFTIAVDVQPLARAIASVARARALHAALASMSEPVLHYRGLTAVREPLLRWLEGVAGDSPTTASTP